MDFDLKVTKQTYWPANIIGSYAGGASTSLVANIWTKNSPLIRIESSLVARYLSLRSKWLPWPEYFHRAKMSRFGLSGMLMEALYDLFKCWYFICLKSNRQKFKTWAILELQQLSWILKCPYLSHFMSYGLKFRT